MNRFMRRYPSPSLVVSITALVVALGGASYSATGGNFILGRTNTATTQSKLAANFNGHTLRLSNSNTGAAATPLALFAAAGHPPLIVNTSVKVPNLNADRLDGLDSTQLARALVVPFEVAPGANTAPIALPVQRAAFVMGTTFVGGIGIGQVSLLRTGFEIRWTGLNSYNSALPPSVSSGASSTQGDHIIYIDNRSEVDIQVNDANSIRIHNGSTVARTGNVTLIW